MAAAAPRSSARRLDDARGKTALLLLRLLLPALKAYAVGYAIDVVPPVVKLLLRFVLRAVRAATKRDGRRGQPAAAGAGPRTDANIDGHVDAQSHPQRSTPTLALGHPTHRPLQSLSSLFSSVGTTLVDAHGPDGFAASCALAMLVWALLDELVSLVVSHPRSRPPAARSKYTATGGVSLASAAGARAMTTFATSTLASCLALVWYQRHGYRTPVRKSDTPRSRQLHPPRPPPPRGESASPGRGSGSDESSTPVLPTPYPPSSHYLYPLTALSAYVTPSPSPSHSTSPVDPRAPSSSSSAHMQATESAHIEANTDTDANTTTTAILAPLPPVPNPSATLDLTLFVLVRAADTLFRFAKPSPHRPPPLSVSSSPSNAQASGVRAASASSAPALLGTSFVQRCKAIAVGKVMEHGDSAVFIASCAIIMWSWFYHPYNLPPSYVKWISSLSSMDKRLLQTLRVIRYGPNAPCTRELGLSATDRWQYGQPCSPRVAALLGDLSEHLGRPRSWGQPVLLPPGRKEAREMKRQAAAATDDRTSPKFVLQGASGLRGRGEMGGVPCEVVHCGVGGGSCWKNAGYRWLKAWRTAMMIYLPVHTLPRLLFARRLFLRQPRRTITRILLSSSRSASFLSTFIASIWFMVCIERTLLFPRLFPSVSHKVWDNGYGPLLGSLVCGFSILVEEKRKRGEMALYVAPRATYALSEMIKPGWLSGERTSVLWVERMLFSISMGIAITAARHRPDVLRGVTRSLVWITARPRPT